MPAPHQTSKEEAMLNLKKSGFISLCLLCGILLACSGALAKEAEGKTDNAPDWFCPEWAAKANFNKPIVVLDTDSSLGRYSLKTKEIGLKDLSRIHGHLCDGLVIAFLEIKAVMEKFFPNGVVDRTDLRAVSKNGPCWVDVASIMTGARINFQTLRIDNSIGNGFIIQKISSGETFEVKLKPDVFPKELAELESKIRKLRTEGKDVSTKDIDQVEKMQNDLSRKLLNSPPTEFLEIKPLPNYKFTFNDMFGARGDVINKAMPR
jgi:formylmethanofuran dehydrogenase subunit E